MDVERIQRLFAIASDSDTFERIGARRANWHISGSCERPVPVSLHSRQTGLAKNLSKAGAKAPPGIELNLFTRCRRCEACLRYTSWLWRSRAVYECEEADKTWFVTFTASPDWHIRCDHDCATRERNFWGQPPDKIFAARSKVMGREMTLFMKRLRKQTRSRIRYLLVTEQHDSAETSEFMRFRPHLHMLLHVEAGSANTVTKRDIEDQWPHGHVKAKLCGPEAAWYVCKYISKSMNARVRASIGYGLEKFEEVSSIYDLWS